MIRLQIKDIYDSLHYFSIQNYAASNSPENSDDSMEGIAKRARDLLVSIYIFMTMSQFNLNHHFKDILKEQQPKRKNLFEGINVDCPKLRRSIVARAVQNFVSSTPFVKTPNCFIDDCSLNISPIDSLYEVSDKAQEDNKKNTAVIVISSEGEHSGNAAKNHNDSHFVPIPCQTRNPDPLLNIQHDTTQKNVYLKDNSQNRKRMDLPRIQHKGKCI